MQSEKRQGTVAVAPIFETWEKHGSQRRGTQKKSALEEATR